jgi:hypothetical protein
MREPSRTPASLSLSREAEARAEPNVPVPRVRRFRFRVRLSHKPSARALVVERWAVRSSAVADEAAVDYVVVRHAPVRDDPDVCWVAIARWKHSDGSRQWCLEYWDAQGEADHDAEVPDETSAVELAQREFDISPADWRPGPQPWGRPE